MSTAQVAGHYVRRMIEKETRGWGDQSNALSRIEAKYGLPYWSLNHIRSGRAKTVEAGLFQRIKAAYLDLCEREIERLTHEVAVEKAKGTNVYLGDIEAEVEALAEKIRTAVRQRK